MGFANVAFYISTLLPHIKDYLKYVNNCIDMGIYEYYKVKW